MMSTVTTLPGPKRNKQGYGKVGVRSNWNVGAFFDDDELAASEPSHSVRPHRTDVTTTYQAKKPIVKTTGVASKPERPLPKRHDTFDVPSSDEELHSPIEIVSKPGFKVRNTLVDDTDSSVTQLAPWERKKVQSDREVVPKKTRVAPASPEAQLKQDLERALLSPESNKISSLTPKDKSSKRREIGSKVSPSQQVRPDASGALARLATRRKEDAYPSTKRTLLATEELDITPRKRARTATPPKRDTEDVVMSDTVAVPTCEVILEKSNRKGQDGNIYELLASSEDELATTKSKVESTHARRTAKRGKLSVYSSKRSTKNGLSAPGRLAEMVTTDTDDTTDAPTRSPSAASKRSSPQQPSTPPTGKSGTPETAIKAQGALTPKQAQLWSQLLPSDPVVPSPSALAIKELSISGTRRTGAGPQVRGLTKSQSDAPYRRARLVDRLKASAPSSGDDSSEEEESIPQTANENEAQEVSELPPKRPSAVQRLPSQSSHSQSQMGASTTTGPKITYSSMRSFLPEDSLEADLMAGLDSELPPHATLSRPVGKPAPTSQESAFDFDDAEDDDGSQGGIRTIHELRAAGRTISGMYDIEELLAEIQNHNVSHRSRRRSALIELATKLIDKSFATRFTAQSLETELALECKTNSDEIADFVLTAVFSLIMASEPPEHTLRTLQDQGVIMWLVKLLDKDADIARLAKDRQNNMSKVAQGSLAKFTDMLKTQSALWGEEKLPVLTPRLMALKALDLLISKLRRLGDRSDLLAAEHVPLILPAAGIAFDGSLQMDAALSFSVLESLSTTQASLNWDAGTVLAIAESLPQLKTESALQRHTAFLMLRLCLNLTTDNFPNCQILGHDPSIVRYFLNAVREGFDALESELDDEMRALTLDLLVLAMGIMMNLAGNCNEAREHAMENEDTLASLLDIFQRGQQHMLDAESVEESVTNVAFGYLAVVLSNLCQNKQAMSFIASKLPGKNLSMLVEAVEEFVLHHQKVDTMNFEGEEGTEVWGAFTEKLKTVLARLKEAERSM